MEKLINKAKETHTLTKDEIIIILKDCKADLLYNAADQTRKKFVGDDVHLRALIEFSNICKCNCFYCGLRYENKSIKRYKLKKDEILINANDAIKKGYKTIVLQSGEVPISNIEYIIEVIKELKQNDIAITLSIGELSFEEYKLLKEAGANRFLLRIETTDENLYSKFHPCMTLENRKNCLHYLKELGYETGTGCLVGLPNQTIESLANDILFFKEINADMVGIGPFISHPQTPLKNEPNGSFELALKVMALTRLLLPNINIPATTAMETLHKNGRLIALQSGANVIMPNFTNLEHRHKYEIYKGKSNCTSINDIEYFEKILKSIGRTVSKTKGNSINFSTD